MAEAWLYDGASAVRRQVSVQAEGGSALALRFPDGEGLSVPKETLTFVESRRDCDIYGRNDVPGWRLGIAPGDAAPLGAVLPGKARYGRLIDRIGLGPAVGIGLAVSAAVVFAGMHFPSWAAPYVPKSWEKKFGDTLVGDFGGRYCPGPAGQAALDKLAAKLSPDAGALNIRVVHVPLVNAAAFPGGHIVIFDELLKEAASPDELAGVLAHEIAHVEERHTTEAMIRHFGIGVFVTALGGTTGASAETLLAARHSRGAEAEADDRAIATLARAGISPAGTAGFFQRMAKVEAKLGNVAVPLSYVSSHPLSAERQRKFRAAAAKGHAYRPALSAEEWKALRGICFNVPKGREKPSFL